MMRTKQLLMIKMTTTQYEKLRIQKYRRKNISPLIVLYYHKSYLILILFIIKGSLSLSDTEIKQTSINDLT